MQIGKNRHNRTIHSDFGGRTTGLRYCSSARNTWYNTTSRVGYWVQPWPRPGKVRKYCGMHTPSNEKTLQRPSTHKVKCGCSVQRIRTNTNNLTKARNRMLLEFLHRSRKWYIFFHNKASRYECCIEPDDYWHPLATEGCVEPCTQNYRPLIVWQFWPIFGATLFCSIRWKTLSFKRHCAGFTGSHRHASSHSNPHA